MARGARVVSIELISELRARLLAYRDEALSILDSADSEVERMHRWVSQEQAAFWQSEVRRREDAVVKARSDLARAEAQKQMGKPSTLDERKALDRAKRAVEEAREKRATVARWTRILDREMQMYRGQVQPLRTHLEGPVQRALMLLARYSQNLEDYVALVAPADDTESRTDRPIASHQSPLHSSDPTPRSSEDWRRHRPDFTQATESERPDLLAILAGILRGATAAGAHPAQSLGISALPSDQEWAILALSDNSDAPFCLERVNASSSDVPDSGWRLYSAETSPRQVGRVRAGELARSVGLFALLQAVPVGSLVVFQQGRLIAAYNPQGLDLSLTMTPQDQDVESEGTP